MWDPERYLTFADHRLRPALELLAQIPNDSASTVVDLGCGPGNVTPHLRERWPHADHIGVDNSREMLDAASTAHPGASWVDADAADWTSEHRVDVIYSNAALHWVDDHHRVFTHLVSQLAHGGTLAVQMPANFGEPTHTTINKVVDSREWTVPLGELLRPVPVHDPAWYHDLLAALTASVNVWSTTYLQELSGEDPITTWCSGSALRPFLTALVDPAERQDFLDAYRKIVSPHYPVGACGTTLLPFTRIFVVATIE